MTGATLVARAGSGDMTVWRVVGAATAPEHRAAWRGWSWRAAVFCAGTGLTIGAAEAVWHGWRPDTVVQTRVLADGPGARAVLADLAVRLASAGAVDARLADAAPGLDGAALDISVRDADPAQAAQRSRALLDALVAAPVASQAQAAPSRSAPRAALAAERRRLLAAAEALSGQAATLSAGLTAIARDLASASRNAPEHKAGRDTLDKANAALADLQLQRLQLASKYQDTYPAVVALDGQIRNLRVFMIDEAHRIDARAAAPDPADAGLAAERERLRAELAQTDVRRRSLDGELAGIDRRMAALPPDAPYAAAVPVPPPVVLMAGPTTRFTGPDDRLAAMRWLVAAGLALSALASLLPFRRRVSAWPEGLVLQPVTTRLPDSGARMLGLEAVAPPGALAHANRTPSVFRG